jgi:hypothetical protein
MKTINVTTAVALAVCGAGAYAHVAADATQTVPTAQAQSAAVAGAEPASGGLSELEAMTFSCPKAALNAAAREAAKIPSQGTYQFAYFKIVNDSHHSAYEVHFTSNYQGEADLKYCVSMYCQQGWDPKTAKTSVTLMSNTRRPMRAAAHGAECSTTPAPVKRPPKR